MPLDCLWKCFRAQEAPLSDDDTVSQPGDNSNQVKPQALEECSHIYKVTRFHRLVRCALCSRIIYGLGRRSYKCIKCHQHLHEGCHHLSSTPCTPDAVHSEDGEIPPDPVQPEDREMPADPIQSVDWEMPADPVQSEDWEMPADPVQSEDCEMPADPVQSEDCEMPADPVQSKDWEMVSEPVQPEYCEMPPDQVVPDISSEPARPSLQDFDLIKFLGRGAFGKVLKVQHKDTKQIYAMKVVKKRAVYDEKQMSRVHTEKRVFQEGCSYPFLVGLHCSFQTWNHLFFVIEYVNGNDLRSLMASQRILEEEQAAFYAAEISLALYYLHVRGIIHRDLKPENILLDAHGHIKVTDYGLCKDGLYPGDSTASFCGTPMYIAPEMVLGIPYDCSVDWWSLGITTFEMMAGGVPFTFYGAEYYPGTDPLDILYLNILQNYLVFPEYFSAEAVDITHHLLEKDPRHRLGCWGSSFADLMMHPFFRGINWVLLESRQVLPPFLPYINDDSDSISEYGIQLTPPADPMDIDQSQFNDFDYINPRWQ